MPATYNLIASNTLSSSAASVTFSAIPNTYTDLVLRASVRSTNASTTDNMFLQVNSLTGVYSNTFMRGTGAAVTSGRRSDFQYDWINGATTTSNTFTSLEFYFPSYTVSQNKPSSLFMAQENNNATAYLYASASLTSSTAVISSLTLSAANFDTGSSFFLYGIKNS